VAGPPDLVDEQASLRKFDDPAVQASLAEQSAALDGSKGALLWVAKAADGEKLAQYLLDSLPVFDGMAAARGRLYLATTDGKVRCFAGK